MSYGRFEVVRTDAGFHSRFVGGNGEIVWTTEVYEARETAEAAIVLILGPDVSPAFPPDVFVDERTSPE